MMPLRRRDVGNALSRFPSLATLRRRKRRRRIAYALFLLAVCLIQVYLVATLFGIDYFGIGPDAGRGAKERFLEAEVKRSLERSPVTEHNATANSRGGKTMRKLLVFLRSYRGKESFECDMNQLWGQDVEGRNLVEILHDYDHVSIDHPADLSSPPLASRPVDVLAFSSNHWSVSSIMSAIKVAKPSVLLLLSDEKGNRAKYERLFPRVRTVYRQYRYATGTRGYSNPANQRILPLGYHCWDEKATSREPWTNREYIWSFIGSVASSETVFGLRVKNIVARYFMGAITKEINRYEMIQALKGVRALQPSFAGSTKGASGDEKAKKNARVYGLSIFAICPRGNAHAETYRGYMGSKNGAIPVTIMREQEWEAMFAHLDIEPPWLRADDTDGAIAIMRNLMERESHKIPALQRDVLDWWDAILPEIRKNIDESVGYCREFWARADQLGVKRDNIYCTAPD